MSIKQFLLDNHIWLITACFIAVVVVKYHMTIRRNRRNLSARTIQTDMQSVEMAKRYGINYWLHLHNNGSLKHYTDE
jgi:hypothetical protein